MGWLGALVLPPIEWATGIRAGKAMHKTLMGAFDAPDLKTLKKNARRTYEGYYARIREVVPPERRLEYRQGDGWEPLCAFLGKEVPDVPFPNVNDQRNHRAYQMDQLRNEMTYVWKKAAPYAVGGLVAAAGTVFMGSRLLA